MEIPQLGDHCAMKGCAQLDFLPFQCSHCQSTFCKEHFSPMGHNCPSAPNIVLTEDEVTQQAAVLHLSSYTCSFEGCNERGPMELLCIVCKNHFCVGHRHHGCIDPKKEARMAKREKWEAPKRQFQAAKEVVDKMVDASIDKARTLSGAKLATANKIQLMRLKQKASGRRNIPMSERAYFLVHWRPVGAEEVDSKPVFVNKTWSMGRVVDMVAEQCKVSPVENTPNAPKLRLFHMDGQLLTEDMTIILESLLAGNVIVDGASISLDFIEPILNV